MFQQINLAPSSSNGVGFPYPENWPGGNKRLSQETRPLDARSVAQLCSSLCDPMDCSLPGSSVHDHSVHNPEIIKPCSYMPFQKNHVKVKLGDVGLICSTREEAAFKSQVTPAQKNSVKFKFSTCVLKAAERAKRFCLSFYRRGQWRNYQTNVIFPSEKKKKLAEIKTFIGHNSMKSAAEGESLQERCRKLSADQPN